MITLTDAPPKADSKQLFANRARGFAKRAAALSLPVYPAAAAAAAIIATAAGAFGTGALPLLQRLAFWTILAALNTILWVCWFTWRVRTPADWWRAAAIGAVVINLPLPLEIAGILRLVGGPAPSGFGATWVHAATVSAAILLIVTAATFALGRRKQSPEVKGRLWRAGVRDPRQIAAIAAEDHYCRIRLSDGSSRLIHARFSDLAEEVGGIDGAIVRRGHWVAASAIRSIEREGRRWRLEMSEGQAILIAPSALAALRIRGWL